MTIKEFHLIGTVQRQSIKLDVRPWETLEDLKSDLSSAFGICDPKGIDPVFEYRVAVLTWVTRSVAAWSGNARHG